MAIGHINLGGPSKILLCLLVILSVPAAGQTSRRSTPALDSSTSAVLPAKNDGSTSDEPESCRVRRVTAFPGSHLFATDFIETIATDPESDADDTRAMWGLTADLSEGVPPQQQAMYISKSIAGVAEFAPFGKITEEHFDKLFNINVKGTLFTVQKALPLLNDGGSIILNGSVASIKGTPAFGVYGATKAALRSFVRTWTSDLKGRHIRSNVISPGPTDTPAIDGQPEDAIARIVSTIPMGRMGEPDEIAKAVLFLASDDSSFVTGIELFVDGGRGQV